jgi:hypothetical protein
MEIKELFGRNMVCQKMATVQDAIEGMYMAICNVNGLGGQIISGPNTVMGLWWAIVHRTSH